MGFILKQPDFPERLRQIHVPPGQLHGEGDSGVVQGRMIAVVGARRCTSYGAETAYRLARELVRAGVVVVSGLAKGIDTKAHEGALDGGGKTVAILGCGLQCGYLAPQQGLIKRIVGQGALLTEYESHEDAAPWHFPQRNRIISGLSSGVVVVEAGLESGSLITARWALEQGREVYAVPGPIWSKMSAGTHRLIQQGAKLVTGIADILEELPWERLPPVAPGQEIGYTGPHGDAAHDHDEGKIIALLSGLPMSVDQLVAASSLRTEQINAMLMTLELKGYVKKLPGGVFIKWNL